ncbi:MAG: hypothetical protein QOF81_2974 [Acidimicrobiaceae bacterium]|nr:hypothetical protein [Acidimicrobiaceae bacterium]
MSFTCPNGHQSETSDYCDQCGARIEGAPAPPATAAPAGRPDPKSSLDPTGGPAPATGTAADPTSGTGAGAGAGVGAGTGDELCPVCQTPRVGQDRFCEECGYDYNNPAPAPGQAGPVLAAASGATSTPAWEAIATADREYYERVAPEGVPFPIHCPARTFLLAGNEIRIGRRSNSRGVQPEVDLSGAPEDGAISHLHCILLEQPSGSYSVVDPGSTNGTTLNDDTTPLMANIAVALADGDRIHLGAWTTITIRARQAAEASGAP